MINEPFLLLILLLLVWLQNGHGVALWTDEEFRSFDQSIVINRNKKMPFGIVYIVYCGPKVSCANYLHVAVQSAKTFRAQSPRVPIAIITSHEGTFSEENVFNHRIPIPKNIIFPGINWLTRLFSLRLSPFEITLEVDSDTVNCGDLHGLFHEIHGLKKGPVDFSVMQAPADPGEVFFPQNGVILYNSSSFCFRAIWHKWIKRQNVFENTTGIRDDQYTLGLILQDRSIVSRCHVHRLNPAMNMVLGWRHPCLNGKKDWNDNMYWSTLVVKSKVFIVHANGAFMFTQQICNLANEQEQVPRLLTYKNEGPPKWPNKNLRFESYRVAYSVEQCKQQLDGNCDPAAHFGNNTAFLVL
eukprot:gene27016-35723_t